jgi:alanine racemase
VERSTAASPATDSRRAVAHVDTMAITANVAHLRSRLVGAAELCAVVKADGYGHGLIESARAAVAGGATRLAVVTAEEAGALSGEQFGLPLVILGPLEQRELATAISSGAELTVWSPDQVGSIADVAKDHRAEVRVHVKLDTGMGRFGAREEDQALATLAAAASSEGVSAHAIWTHFATADELGDEYFPQQLARFSSFVELARREHPELLAHAANSAATLRSEQSHFDFVRCGIAIYGLDPFGEDVAAAGLRPALSLTSYVASLRELGEGESVGYGRRFTAEREVRIATIPIGYGDGWRRILSNNCEVLIAGNRHAQRGTVSMDSLMVELGDDCDVALGDAVTLIGSDGEQRITTEDVARRARTINYEVTCGLTSRTTRTYGPGPAAR